MVDVRELVFSTPTLLPKPTELFLTPTPLVRHGSHWDGSLQNRLGDEWTCGMTLALVYMLCCLSAVWLQLQMKGRKSE